MKITKFEDLNIWKTALRGTKLIYDFTAKKNFQEILFYKIKQDEQLFL